MKNILKIVSLNKTHVNEIYLYLKAKNIRFFFLLKRRRKYYLVSSKPVLRNLDFFSSKPVPHSH